MQRVIKEEARFRPGRGRRRRRRRRALLAI